MEVLECENVSGNPNVDIAINWEFQIIGEYSSVNENLLLIGGDRLMNFKIVSDYEKEDLRKKYIESFVDTKTEHYKKYIATLREYPDGMCHDGYLWDSLIENYETIEKTMEHAIEYLKNKRNVLVMWDIYSKYRVYDNKIFSSKYPKDTIVETDSSELCQFIEKEWGDKSATEDKYLAEDIYI